MMILKLDKRKRTVFRALFAALIIIYLTSEPASPIDLILKVLLILIALSYLMY